MALTSKLQIKPGLQVCVLNPPRGFKLDAPTTRNPRADALLLFIRTSRELRARGRPFFQAAKQDRLAWLAYPKAGQLGTDVNRDILWKLARSHRIRPVRNISIDRTWSALRFRPA